MTIEYADFRSFNNGLVINTLSQADKCSLQPVFLTNKTTRRRRVLLLFHGFSSSPAVFRLLIPTLANYYDCIAAPTLPGHGQNIKAFSHINRLQLQQFALDSFRSLSAQYDCIDVMGLSLGGVLAYFLSQQTTINHLYLLAPAFDLHLNIAKIIPLTIGLSHLGFSRLRSFAGNLCTKEHYEIAYRQLPISTVFEVLSFINEFKFTLNKTRTTLFLGRHDKVVNSHQVASRFAGDKNTQTIWLEHSAHVLPLDNDKQSITDLILSINNFKIKSVP